MLSDVFDDHTTVTFVSGHEHLLQKGIYETYPVVGSGTAVRTDPGKVGQRTQVYRGRPRPRGAALLREW